MRVPSRTPEWARLARKEQWRNDRAAARTLRMAFPAAESVRVELSFEDPAASPPAAQSHVMHPPARAFFEFPCPYANCDGKFDLDGVASQVLTHASLQAQGTLECTGVRSRDGITKLPCGVRAHYTVAAQYHKETDSKK